MQLFAHGVKISLFTKIRVINLQLVWYLQFTILYKFTRDITWPQIPSDNQKKSVVCIDRVLFFGNMDVRCHMDRNL